jgi:hypothetical protein
MNTSESFHLIPLAWSWTAMSWRPRSQPRNLVKAGALILAEVDRLDRATNRTHAETPNV